MKKEFAFEQLTESLRGAIQLFPDKRTGKNLIYSMEDAHQILIESGHIEPFRVFNGDLLIALDATWYFSSKKIHCDNCCSIKHKDGSITYYHSALTPALFAPGRGGEFPLVPD